MKILILHNAYQQAGGEDTVINNEQKLLAANHQVLYYSVTNDSINSFPVKINTAVSSHYSMAQRKILYRYLLDQQPDIVHVHNFFPQLTPSIYDACIEANIPVVQTLHNYRTICPGALLMRNGKICETCVLHSPYHAVLHRCYRDSYLGSWAVARMVSMHRQRKTWKYRVNHFIALTEFAKHKFITAGFPKDKLSVKPNFYYAVTKKYKKQSTRLNQALFVGRFSKEKGVSILLEAWKSINFNLLLVGKGTPQPNYYNKLKNIQYIGAQTQEEISKLMEVSKFLVFPSIWYEGFPMVIVEAFAHGLPIICSHLGSMIDIIEDGVTGLHFEAGNPVDLTEKINWMIAHPKKCQQMGENAQAIYFEKYTPKKNYEMLIDIYQQAMNHT